MPYMSSGESWAELPPLYSEAALTKKAPPSRPRMTAQRVLSFPDRQIWMTFMAQDDPQWQTSMEIYVNYPSGENLEQAAREAGWALQQIASGLPGLV